MAKSAGNPILIIVSEAELPMSHRIWGTGGWLPPEQREGLDWLTLSRLLGWGVTVTPRNSSLRNPDLCRGYQWIIVACDPDSLRDEFVAYLAKRVESEPVLVLARTGQAGRLFAQFAGTARTSERISGRSLSWIGPGRKSGWRCRKMLHADRLELSERTSIWATLDGAPVIVGRKAGRGIAATVGFHPSLGRDVDGAATALLKHLLIWGSTKPVAWIGLERTFVLRMDDPGSPESVHNRRYSFPKLGEAEWAAMSIELKRRNARMSIGYVSGWVDDGDSERGVLRVAGHVPPRVAGQTYPSSLVRYEGRSGHTKGVFFDYEAEFRGIQALRAKGLGDVELHGYTHMHPDSGFWARATDRYENTSWYREFGRVEQGGIPFRPPNQHRLALGITALRKYFDVFPTTLICPGDEWKNEVLECALELGLQLVASYYLALRDNNRFCWATHVCSPYLNEPDESWFDAGLPVVGYFHDYDVGLEGVHWVSTWLDRWQDSGAQKFLDFRELAAAVSRTYSLEEHGREVRLMVRGERAPRLVRPLEVMIKVSKGKMPSQLSLSHDNKDVLLKVYSFDRSVGRVILPASV